MGYTISVPAFEGPLDLLLHLIERRELDITVISLAQVTDQYLQQIEALKENRLPHLIDFVVVGARLAWIKSHALLPRLPVVPLEGSESEDPAELLVRQLKVYRQFKQSAEFLKQREAAGRRTHLRVAPPPRVASKLDLTGVTPGMLLKAMLEVLERLQQREASVEVAQPRSVTVESQMERVRLALSARPQVYLTDVLSPQVNHVEVAVTLLAVLEMIKRREATARQEVLFGPILIKRVPAGPYLAASDVSSQLPEM